MKLTKPERAKEEQTSVTFRIDFDAYERLSAAAHAADVTVSEALRQLVDAFLKEKKK